MPNEMVVRRGDTIVTTRDIYDLSCEHSDLIFPYRTPLTVHDTDGSGFVWVKYEETDTLIGLMPGEYMLESETIPLIGI